MRRITCLFALFTVGCGSTTGATTADVSGGTTDAQLGDAADVVDVVDVQADAPDGTWSCTGKPGKCCPKIFEPPVPEICGPNGWYCAVEPQAQFNVSCPKLCVDICADVIVDVQPETDVFDTVETEDVPDLPDVPETDAQLPPLDAASDAGGGKVDDPCGEGQPECAAGLVCCYPCGIPGCQNKCAVPCTDAWCQGGCPLLP